LEEARQADLLMHVADASNEAVLDQISSVYKVLRDLDIDEKDTLLILNKIDRPGAAERVKVVQARYPNAIPISAFTREGFSMMSLAVSSALTHDFVELEVRLPPSDGKTAAWLSSVSEVLSKQYDDDHVFVRSRIPSSHAGRLVSMGYDVRIISGKLPQRTIELNTPTIATFKPVASIPSEEPAIEIPQSKAAGF